MKTNIKSFILGAAAGITAFLLIGAATRQPFIDEIFPLRFRVLDVSRHGEPANGRQTTVLRLAPFHGKIDQKSYDFRREHETPQITVVTMVDTGYEIRTNDIIDFRAVGHLKDSDK
jgi:hypothetical protein